MPYSRKAYRPKTKKSSAVAKQGYRRYAQIQPRRINNIGIRTAQLQLDDVLSATFYTYILGANIVKGTDRGQRVGDQIFFKYLTVNFFVENEQVNTRVKMRMALLETLRPGENTNINLFETWSDVNNPRDWQANDPLSLIEPFNRMKYRVHFDKVYTLGTNSGNDGYKNTRLVKEFIKVNRMMDLNTEGNLNDKVIPRLTLVHWFVNDDGTPITAGIGVNKNRVYREFYNM